MGCWSRHFDGYLIWGNFCPISSRRRTYVPRPLTPPYVRFRIRRFMKHIEVFAVDRAVTQVQVDQRSVWGKTGSCARPRRSTRGLARWWQTSKPALPPNHTSSGSLPEYKAVSTAARGCSAICDAPIRPVPRKCPLLRTAGSSSPIPAKSGVSSSIKVPSCAPGPSGTIPGAWLSCDPRLRRHLQPWL